MFCMMQRVFHLLEFICLITLVCGQEEYLRCGQKLIKTRVLRKRSIALASDWPWHAAIFTNNKYTCGGSIIDANTILTASFCVSNEFGVLSKTQLSVHVGRDHLNKTSEHLQIHEATKIIVHAGFSFIDVYNDIALIKLSSNITMNKYVQPVCLWTMNSEQELITGKNGTFVGFGLNEQYVLSGQLKQALIRVIDTLTCIEQDRDLFGTYLTKDMFCGIGQETMSACNGDAGSGMFFKVRGKWYVRGLVSFSPTRGNTDQCDPRKPTVFTDVAKYLDWIKPHIDQRVLQYESDVIDEDTSSPGDKLSFAHFL